MKIPYFKAMNDRSDIISGITSSMHDISALIENCTSEQLNRPEPGKWNVAEQVVHLGKSVAPLNTAMGLPKLTFFIFGRVSFSRTYEEIKGLYQNSLLSGAKASRAYIPPANKTYEKSRLIHDFVNAYEKYISHIADWAEEDLDTYRVPHPILGKLTFREMAYFTQYHMEHHLSNIQKLV